MLTYAEKKSLKKKAEPIFCQFFLDGLGSREVFFTKTAEVYRVNHCNYDAIFVKRFGMVLLNKPSKLKP